MGHWCGYGPAYGPSGGVLAFCGADGQSVTWWEWTVVAIWGPAAVAVAGMLSATSIQKAWERLKRRPLRIDRRQPHGAALREAIDRRGVKRVDEPAEIDLAEPKDNRRLTA